MQISQPEMNCFQVKKGDRQRMEKGTVIWFSDEKGYGFIARENGGAGIFVHYKGIVSDKKRKTLSDGDSVLFREEEINSRLCAVDVTVVN